MKKKTLFIHLTLLIPLAALGAFTVVDYLVWCHQHPHVAFFWYIMGAH